MQRARPSGNLTLTFVFRGRRLGEGQLFVWRDHSEGTEARAPSGGDLTRRGKPYGGAREFPAAGAHTAS